jgi:hypothetical protein
MNRFISAWGILDKSRQDDQAGWFYVLERMRLSGR